MLPMAEDRGLARHPILVNGYGESDEVCPQRSEPNLCSVTDITTNLSGLARRRIVEVVESWKSPDRGSRRSLVFVESRCGSHDFVGVATAGEPDALWCILLPQKDGHRCVVFVSRCITRERSVQRVAPGCSSSGTSPATNPGAPLRHAVRGGAMWDVVTQAGPVPAAMST